MGLAVLLAGFAMARSRGVPFEMLAYDSTSVLDAPVYVGSISRFTLMVWSAVGAQALLVAILVPARRRVMGWLGGVTLLMAADDALRLHEGVGPRVGIPEMAFYAFYAVVALGLLVWFYRHRSPAGGVYLMGGALMAVSVITDVFFDDDTGAPGDALVLLEDGAKLLGALVWAAVPALVALEHARAQAVDPQQQPIAAER